MAVIDVQRGAALNNLHHAGRPRASQWAPVCLWVVPPTRYPCRNSVEANGPDWGIGLSAWCEHSFFLPSVWGTPCAPPATPNLPVLPSSVNGDWVSWNMEAWKRVSISISFPDKSFFSQHKDLGQLVPNISLSQCWRQRIHCCTTYHVWKMGQVHCKYSACRCMTTERCLYLWLFLRQKKGLCLSQ